jgi:hypothetical protein
MRPTSRVPIIWVCVALPFLYLTVEVARCAEVDRTSLAKSSVRPPGRGVTCGFQAKENGSDAPRIRVGGRRGGAQR